MVYKVIGLMSGSSLDGVDLAYAELKQKGHGWTYEIPYTACIEYTKEWADRLSTARYLNAYDYVLLHYNYGELLGKMVNNFINKNNLHHKVQLIGSHGHTIFHSPENNMTSQIGNGAAVAAQTGINVVSDLRDMDIALGGQGAPIVPMGEQLFWPEVNFFLNIGGIANLSIRNNDKIVAFDICPANKVLNMLAMQEGMAFDNDGYLSSKGFINKDLLQILNAFPYYKTKPPKSLANEFGTDIIFPLIKSFSISTADALCTYCEHIAEQVALALDQNMKSIKTDMGRLMVTGGGAFNAFLLNRLRDKCNQLNVEIYLPEQPIIQYKEALIMALLGVLRWREQITVLAHVTGSRRNSIGGAIWMGQEA